MDKRCQFCGWDLNFDGNHWCPNGGNRVCIRVDSSSRAVQRDEIDEDPAPEGRYRKDGVWYCNRCGSAAHGAGECTVSGTYGRSPRVSAETERDVFREQAEKLRARVAELEANDAPRGPCKREHIEDAITTRLEAEIESRMSKPAMRAAWQVVEEDLRRKREECSRLETALAATRASMHESEVQADSYARQLAESGREVARLRRELGRKR